MYDLPYHKASSDEELRLFIERHPFATLIGIDRLGHPVATQLPLLVDHTADGGTLSGHMMKSTDHYAALVANPSALAIFSSPHTYVSGTWYSDPHTPSTWNYMSVHVRGSVQWLDDSDLEDLLRRTSTHFEDDDPASPTAFDNLPRALVERLLPMIAGFTIEIQSMTSVFKLSQDRDAQSYRSIMERLRTQDDAGRYIASEMERREKDLFPGSREP